MNIKWHLFVPCLLLASTSVGSSALSNLGEKMETAKARSTEYGSKYNAIEPLFKADNSGMVVWECWAAPARMWSKAEAMDLASDLLPKKLKRQVPKAGVIDGSSERYTFSDGTMIILTGFSGRYIDVEVRAPSYKGPDC